MFENTCIKYIACKYTYISERDSMARNTHTIRAVQILHHQSLGIKTFPLVACRAFELILRFCFEIFLKAKIMGGLIKITTAVLADSKKLDPVILTKKIFDVGEIANRAGPVIIVITPHHFAPRHCWKFKVIDSSTPGSSKLQSCIFKLYM